MNAPTQHVDVFAVVRCLQHSGHYLYEVRLILELDQAMKGLCSECYAGSLPGEIARVRLKLGDQT